MQGLQICQSAQKPRRLWRYALHCGRGRGGCPVVAGPLQLAGPVAVAGGFGHARQPPLKKDLLLRPEPPHLQQQNVVNTAVTAA